MSENNIERNNKCPGCGRHCDLSAPGCPRGEAFARGGRPSESNFEADHHGRPDGHGPRNHHGRDKSEDRGFHGEREHREHHHPFDAEEYRGMDTEGKLGLLLTELHHMSRFGMESRGGQGRILQLLAEEGDMTQRTLTEKLGIQPGSVSEVIGKLERAGYVTRSENAGDRRTADVHLTQAGREQLETKKQEKPALFSALSEEEKGQLLSLLEKLCGDWRERLPRERRGHGNRPMHTERHGQ